jgi:hypothetical protein
MDMMRAKGHLKEYDTFAVETSFWVAEVLLPLKSSDS